MSKYRNILLAVELNSESDHHLIKKAGDLLQDSHVRLTLIHAVEHLTSYGAAYGVAVGADIEQMLIDTAKNEMRKVAQKLNVSDQGYSVKVGPASVIILEEAERVKADLIVLGSHGRHGVRLLLGSTANAVVHEAKCDVLALRVVNK